MTSRYFGRDIRVFRLPFTRLASTNGRERKSFGCDGATYMGVSSLTCECPELGVDAAVFREDLLLGTGSVGGGALPLRPIERLETR